VVSFIKGLLNPAFEPPLLRFEESKSDLPFVKRFEVEPGITKGLRIEKFGGLIVTPRFSSSGY
jgi:hypothetical protein